MPSSTSSDVVLGRSEMLQTQQIVVLDLQIPYPDNITMALPPPNTGNNSVQPDVILTTGTLEKYTILSLGNYLNGMFGTKHSKILVWDKYLEMLKVFTDHFDLRWSKGIVVTGQPGIGKCPI
jgi:hypothetical protein